MSHSMRPFSICLALVAALTFVGHPARVTAQQSAPAIDASAIPGNWSFVVDSPHGKMTFAMELRLETPGKVVGTMSNEQMGTATITGAFAEQTLKFTAESSGGTFTFTGKFKDRDTIAGFLSGHAGDLVGIATRVKK